jgi:hypothetical protein
MHINEPITINELLFYVDVFRVITANSYAHRITFQFKVKKDEITTLR